MKVSSKTWEGRGVTSGWGSTSSERIENVKRILNLCRIPYQLGFLGLEFSGTPLIGFWINEYQQRSPTMNMRKRLGLRRRIVLEAAREIATAVHAFGTVLGEALAK